MTPDVDKIWSNAQNIYSLKMLNAMQVMKAMLALTCVIFKENNGCPRGFLYHHCAFYGALAFSGKLNF